MITIFKRIRETLLHEGRLRQYLKYALGEILLVVIGILIALQINNWNAFRESRVVECKHLARLIADTEEDLAFYNSRLQHLDRFCEVRQRLLDLAHHRIAAPLLDSLVPDWFNFNSTMAYQSAVIMNNPEAFDVIRSDTVITILRDVHAAYEYVDKAMTISNDLKMRYGIPANIRHHWFIDSRPHTYQEWSRIAVDEDFPGTLWNDLIADQNAMRQVQNMISELEALLQSSREYQSFCR